MGIMYNPGQPESRVISTSRLSLRKHKGNHKNRRKVSLGHGSGHNRQLHIDPNLDKIQQENIEKEAKAHILRDEMGVLSLTKWRKYQRIAKHLNDSYVSPKRNVI